MFMNSVPVLGVNFKSLSLISTISSEWRLIFVSINSIQPIRNRRESFKSSFRRADGKEMSLIPTFHPDSLNCNGYGKRFLKLLALLSGNSDVLALLINCT